MKLIDTREKFLSGRTSKPDFIRAMYEIHHAKLFDYADYLKQTNISSIDITDDIVTMTSRDNGVRMICPSGDYRVAPIESLNFLDYEKDDSDMIMRLAGGARTFIDIGANMGWYSINIAKFYPDCMVYAFEPIPKTYSFLLRNIELNELENIHTYDFGFSNESKQLTFYFYPEGSGTASSANLSDREDVEKVTCQVETLDSFVASNGISVDFIKCDVEGAELFAFQGGARTLARDKPIVFSEMLRKWAAKFNYHPNEIINLFNTMGYRCFYVHEQKLKEIFQMTDETTQTNFFFLHKNKHQDQISEYE